MPAGRLRWDEWSTFFVMSVRSPGTTTAPRFRMIKDREKPPTLNNSMATTIRGNALESLHRRIMTAEAFQMANDVPIWTDLTISTSADCQKYTSHPIFFTFLSELLQKVTHSNLHEHCKDTTDSKNEIYAISRLDS